VLPDFLYSCRESFAATVNAWQSWRELDGSGPALNVRDQTLKRF
jgi:hypothetical protein